MRIVLLLLALAAGAGVLLYLFPDTAKQLGGLLPEGLQPQQTARVYKWQDADGNWQLTDTPPPAGISYERTDYHEDLNVLPVPPGIRDK